MSLQAGGGTPPLQPVAHLFGNKRQRGSKIARCNIPIPIALLDTDGAIVVKYTYDAWGNHTVEDNTDCGLGTLNPFRYRGYYYDTETGLYYLQTRYYDPEIGRFVAIDDAAYLAPDTIGGLNLYSYCNNNPVMCVDPWGTAAETVWNTAVLVTRFDSQGLWVVGHTELYFYNSQTKEWLRTEFVNQTNKGSLREIMNSAAIENGSNPPPIYANAEYSSIGQNYVVLEGDFAASVSEAQEYVSGKKNIGEYDFFFHNCSHYTDMILATAEIEGTFTNLVAKWSPPISVPVLREVALSVARAIDLALANDLGAKVNHIGDALGTFLKSNVVSNIKRIWNKIKFWD